MSTRTLLRGGTVITSAKTGEVLPATDILIGADGTIEAIGPNLDAADADVVDVTGRIVLPGFVDTHRHTWQSVVRNVASDWSLTEYLAGLHSGLSKHFRPEDTYAGNYLGALEALDAGITTLVDWSHNLATPAHADAAVQALKDTGMRAVFAHGGGNKQWGAPLPSPNNHPAEDAKRAFATSTSATTPASSPWRSRCAARSSRRPRSTCTTSRSPRISTCGSPCTSATDTGASRARSAR